MHHIRQDCLIVGGALQVTVITVTVTVPALEIELVVSNYIPQVMANFLSHYYAAM